MNDDPMDRIPSFDRVSLRAVLVAEGDDPGPGLQQAGIIDPIALPVMFADDEGASTGLFGDGITDNLTAVLQPDEPGSGEPGSDDKAAALPLRAGSPQPRDQIGLSQTDTVRLPAAYGVRPLAPVRPAVWRPMRRPAKVKTTRPDDGAN